MLEIPTVEENVEAPVTPRVPPIEVLLVTPNVDESVAAPVTPKVPPTVVLLEMPTVEENVAAPVTPRVPPTDTFPLTVRLLPIPTPPAVTRDEFVVSDMVIGAATAVAVFNLMLLLNITGPSNCERILLEFPPSTNKFCLIVT